jgi:hypothetical protein
MFNCSERAKRGAAAACGDAGYLRMGVGRVDGGKDETNPIRVGYDAGKWWWALTLVAEVGV